MSDGISTTRHVLFFGQHRPVPRYPFIRCTSLCLTSRVSLFDCSPTLSKQKELNAKNRVAEWTRSLEDRQVYLDMPLNARTLGEEISVIPSNIFFFLYVCYPFLFSRISRSLLKWWDNLRLSFFCTWTMPGLFKRQNEPDIHFLHILILLLSPFPTLRTTPKFAIKENMLIPFKIYLACKRGNMHTTSVRFHLVALLTRSFDIYIAVGELIWGRRNPFGSIAWHAFAPIRGVCDDFFQLSYRRP